MRRRRVNEVCILLACLAALGAPGAAPAETAGPSEKPAIDVRPVEYPGRLATRYEVAFLIAHSFPLEELAQPERDWRRQRPFGDVPATHWAYGSVDQLRKASVCEGCPRGVFQGARTITRYEFAGALSRLMARLHERYPNVPLTRPVLKPEPFADMSPGRERTRPVEWIRQAGLVQGYPDRTFKGKRPLRRDELYLILRRLAEVFAPGADPPRPSARALEYPERRATRYEVAFLVVDAFGIDGSQTLQSEGVDPPPAFRDVPAKHWARGAVEAMRASGLTKGYTGGAFRGEEAMTRFELAMLLWRTLHGLSRGHALPRDRSLTEAFADIPPDIHSPWGTVVYRLLWAGTIEGYPDREFHGRRAVTRRELETCLRRAVSLLDER